MPRVLFSCDRILLRSMFSMSRILVLSSFTIFGCSALKVLNLESAEGNFFELQSEVWYLRKLFIKLKYKSDIFLNCWECTTWIIIGTFQGTNLSFSTLKTPSATLPQVFTLCSSHQQPNINSRGFYQVIDRNSLSHFGSFFTLTLSKKPEA